MTRESFGDYLLTELVASGEAADVWLAEDRQAERVIIKRILPPWSNDKNVRQIFFNIVKDFALLRHPHLVAMLDFGQIDEFLYVVFERVDGIFLRQVLRARQALDERQVVIIAAGLLAGLSHLHRAKNPFTRNAIAHSDVSPANILIDELGRPRVVDMGFSRLVFEAGLPGKPSVPDIRYIYPEVLSGSLTNARSDIYGAGMILKDLLQVPGCPPLPLLTEISDKAISDGVSVYDDATVMLSDLLPLIQKHSISIDDVVLDNISGWNASIEKALAGNMPAGESIALLNDRYEVIKELGRGAMGVVFHARDKTLDEELAIKVLNSKACLDLDRFHQELRLARKVNHRNVARVFHLEEAKGIAYYTMEYVEGEALESLIRRKSLSGTGFDLAEAISLAIQLAGGLSAIHACGVVHRDIKPANILVQKDGRAVITDFGVAKNEDEELGMTQVGTTIGTPVYMAPEQMVGKKVDQRADIYALGVILYEMVTGKRPHYGNTSVTLYMQKQNAEHEAPRRINGNISRRLEKVLMQVLEPDPGKRIATAGELIDKLERCHGH